MKEHLPQKAVGGKGHASFYRSLSDRHLSLILFPTEQCNFRCTYCYEDFKLRRMSEDVQVGILKLIENRLPNLSSIDISWFGGEPLLAPEIISKINGAIQSNCHSELEFSSNITTNGYLMLPRCLIEWLISGYRDGKFQLMVLGKRMTKRGCSPMGEAHSAQYGKT